MGSDEKRLGFAYEIIMSKDKRPPQWNLAPEVNFGAIGGVGQGDVDLKLLAWLQKYDPSAGFSPYWESSEGSPRGGEYSYDDSLFPKSSKGIPFMELRGTHTNARNAFGNIRTDLINPNDFYKDPIYGEITSNNNIRDSKPQWWEKLAPLAIGGIAGFANPGAFASLSLGAKAAMAAPTLARTWAQKGKLSPLDIMGLAAPFAASALPGDLGSLAKTGLSAFNTYNAFNKGNTVTGLSGLYNTGKSLLPVTGGG